MGSCVCVLLGRSPQLQGEYDLRKSLGPLYSKIIFCDAAPPSKTKGRDKHRDAAPPIFDGVFVDNWFLFVKRQVAKP